MNTLVDSGLDSPDIVELPELDKLATDNSFLLDYLNAQ